MPLGERGHGRLELRILFLGELDAPFDFANRIEIFGDAIAIVRAEPALQPAHLSG